MSFSTWFAYPFYVDGSINEFSEYSAAARTNDPHPEMRVEWRYLDFYSERSVTRRLVVRGDTWGHQVKAFADWANELQ
jgi:hypothetical protein